MKNLLKGKKFASAEEILDEICWILDAIRREKLNAVFDNWERRLQRCITMNGEYVD
jgi:hypothetical protein